MIVTVPRPLPRDLNYEQRHDILDWLAAMNIPNRSVESVELVLIDCPAVQVTRFLKDEDGLTVCDESGPRRAVSDHVVTVEPPEWWQPASRWSRDSPG